MATIQKPVGKGAKNDKWDVMTVQILLNKFIVPGCLPGINVLVSDGVCGQKTLKAIVHFQSGIVGMKSPDALVHPGGTTLIALNGPLKWAKPSTPDAPSVDPTVENTGQVRPEKLEYRSTKGARLFTST